MLRRREFFVLLSGGMASLPQALSAQQKERIAHVGVLMNFSENDDEGNSRATALGLLATESNQRAPEADIAGGPVSCAVAYKSPHSPTSSILR